MVSEFEKGFFSSEERVLKIIEEVEFTCCDTGGECSNMLNLKEELKQRIKSK